MRVATRGVIYCKDIIMYLSDSRIRNAQGAVLTDEAENELFKHRILLLWLTSLEKLSICCLLRAGGVVKVGRRLNVQQSGWVVVRVIVYQLLSTQYASYCKFSFH